MNRLKLRGPVKESLKSSILICAIVAGLFAGGLGVPSATAAVGDTAAWVFNAPAIGNPAQNPPYVPVGTVSLVETAAGVQFTLDPNELNGGYQNNASINQLFYAYIGSTPLTAASFQSLSTNVQGTSAAVDSFGIVTPSGTEAGYNPLSIQVNWGTSNSGGGLLRLQPYETSSWLVLGTTIADFAAVATANNKPSPMNGVLSLSGFSGDSSNWVAAIPEPATYAMLLVGLGLLAGHVARSRAR